MNFPAITLEKFSSIKPPIVINYLHENRWREQEVVPNQHSIWKLDHPSEGEFVLLLPLNPAIADFPDRMYDVVRTLAAVERRSEAEIANDLADVAQIASDLGQEILNLHLNFPQPRSNAEAPAKKLGILLSSLQDTLDAIGEVESGRASPFGKVSEEVTKRTSLSVVGLFKGSFGIRLATALPDPQLNFLEIPLAEAVLDSFIKLINSSNDKETLRELMLHFQRRLVTHYRRFLLALTQTNADFRLEWGSANVEKGGIANLSNFEAWQAVNTINKIEIGSPEEYTIRGKLLSISISRRTFEILDLLEDKTYAGKIADDAFSQDLEISINPPKIYTATIQATIKTNPNTGEGNVEYKLTSLTPWLYPNMRTQTDTDANSSSEDVLIRGR